MNKRSLKKFITSLVMLCMLFSSLGTAFGASVSMDIKGHWAASQISDWIDKGIIKGYEDGSFKPDNKISRAEFIALINRTFGFTEKAAISFSDVSPSNWAYPEIAVAIKAGYLKGFADGTIGADKPISRQEAAVIANRLLVLGNIESEATSFADSSTIALWAKESVNAVVAKGIMKGYAEDNSFKPDKFITRAEAVVTLDRVAAARATVYNAAGTYGPASGTETINGDVVINVAGVILQNTVINGNLLFAAGIGSGDATLNNVNVKGVTKVKGGGENSIHFNNSIILSIIVDKKNGTVRIVAEGSSTVGEVTVNSPTTIQETGVSGSGFSKITLSDLLPADSKVILIGAFDTLTVKGDKIQIDIPEGSVQEVLAETTATGMKLNLGEHSKIVQLILEAAVKIIGDGIIERAKLSDIAQKESTFEKEPLKKEGKGGTPFRPDPSSTPTAPASVPGNSGPDANPDLQIVNNGQTVATIKVALNADNQIQAAAAKLAEYVEKSTGAELPIVVDDTSGQNLPVNNEVEIYVGAEGLPTGAGQENPLVGLSNDGFVIQQNGTRITIAGPTSWGTEFGINEFLERFVGVRWLAPGEDWEDVPQLSDLSVPANEFVRQEPAFISREFDVFATNTPEREQWARNNRMHGLVEFRHNLFNLFPPSEYKDTFPSFYSTGAYLDSVGGWQPCFTAEGIVQEAVNNINSYFDANPNATSYSLAVNDALASGSGYCEDNPSHPAFPNKINSIGVTDMSNIYYNWVNEVSEGVFLEHPDKFLGVLAYGEVYDPPTNVTLDPRVIVYITDERLTWNDSDYMTLGHDKTTNWLEVAPGIAFYEYMYGTPYTVPRTNFNTLDDAYKYANEVGVSAHFAEIYPNFGEGPKPWLSTRLQWNPEQDTDALINEWYERAVGAAAAADLATYYEIWRDFWESRIFNTDWYSAWKNSNPRNNYMNFLDESYLKAVTAEDIALSRSLLESVVTKAVTVKQKKRAEDLLRSFEYYEASALSYPDESKVIVHPENETEALALVQSVIEKIRMAEKRQYLIQEFAGDSFFQHALSPYQVDDLTLGGYGRVFTGITKAEIDAIVAWLEQENTAGAVHLLLNDLSSNDQEAAVRNYAYILLRSADPEAKKQLIYNPSFEFAGATADLADSWNLWLYNGLEMKRTNAEKRNGEYSIKAEGINFGGIIQPVPVQPGIHLVSFAYYSPEGSTGKGTIQLALDMWDASNGYLGTIRPYLETKRIADTAGQWVSFFWTGELPEGIAKVDAMVLMENFDTDQMVYVDDFSIDRLSPDIYADNPKTPLDLNPSFEFAGATADSADSWNLWLYNGLEMKRTDETQKSGDYSIVAKGITLGGIMQALQAQPGLHGFTAAYYSPPGLAGNGTIRFQIDLYDAENNFIGDIKPTARRISNSAGGWSNLEWIGELPSGVSNVTVAVLLENFETEQKVFVDDINFHRLSPDFYASNPKTPINLNASFENAGDTPESADPWNLWLYSGLEMKRTNEVKKNGDYSILAKGINLGGIMQEVPAQKGTYGMSVAYYSPPGSTGNGTIRLQLDLYDAQNNFIGDIKPVARRISNNAGNWTIMEWICELPEEVEKVTAGVFLENFDGNQEIYLDDFKFYRLSPDLYADSPKTPINLNASFEYAGDTPETADQWNLWLYNGLEMKRTNEVKKNGDYSIVAKSINYGGIMQQVPIEAGIHGMSFAYYSPPGSTGNGTIRIQLDLYDAQNNFIGDIKPAERRISYTAGDWFNMDWTGEIPEGVSKVTVGVFLENFGVGQEIYIDDVNFYSLP